MLEIDDAVQFLQRMQSVMGYPWTSRPTSECLEALGNLKARLAAQADESDEDTKPADWAKVG